MTYRSLFPKVRSHADETPQKRWSLLGFLGRSLKRICYVLGAIMLVWIILSASVMMMIGGSGHAPMPDKMVVVLKLEKGLSEKANTPSLMDPFPYLQPTVHQVIAQIDTAAKDTRVKGFVFSLKSGGINLSQAQELRAAIERFRATGKFTKFYTTSFADYGQGLSLYYLASAFDEVWMQPVGMLAITGVSMEMPYMRTVLDKIGATPEFLQREEYKGAMENFTDKQMSAASRETIEGIVTDYADQMVSAIAKDRKISKSVIQQYVDTGLMSGDEALKAKLIDRLDYGDVMIDEIDKTITGDADSEEEIYVPLDQYHHKEPVKGRPQVALIQAVGTIAPGTARETSGAAADDIAAALYEAAEDDDIKAVLLRIDSPGGSPSASETIRRGVLKVQQKGKKVIVSMGAVAASGGYWIAAPADVIYASPATLTGSIGVVMGKVSLAQLWEKLGINWQGVSYGENSDMWSMNEPLDAQGLARMNALIDDTYDQFLSRVAEGRKMTKEQARSVAKGRAWTGAQAKERGLVDALGGQTDALDHLARELGKKSRDDLEIVVMPREKPAFEKLLELMGQQVAMGQWFTQLNAQLNLWRGAQGVQAVEPLGLFQ